MNADRIQQAIAQVISAIRSFLDLVLAGLAAIEVWIRGELTQLGVAPPIQTVILIAVALLLIVAALRLFGGFLRVILLIFLILLVVQAVIPMVSP